MDKKQSPPSELKRTISFDEYRNNIYSDTHYKKNKEISDVNNKVRENKQNDNMSFYSYPFFFQ